MRAATTKIPHLLYEKGLLKIPNEMCDFIKNWWFIWWEQEKTPEIYKNTKSENKGKNYPFGCPPIPMSAKIEAVCFPVSKNTENKPDLHEVLRES